MMIPLFGMTESEWNEWFKRTALLVKKELEKKQLEKYLRKFRIRE